MLQLNQDQIDAFAKSSEERFYQRMVEHVQQAFPDACSGSSNMAIQTKLRELADIAKNYSVTKKSDLSRFFNMAYLFGENFHQELPWANSILTEQSISGSAKMALLQSEACNLG